LIGFYKHQEFK